MTRKEFAHQLGNLYPKAPSNELMQEYFKKLSEWRVGSKDLQRLFDHLTETYEFFPTIADLTTSANQLSIGKSRLDKPPINWALFDFDDLRHAIKINSPADFIAPDGAKNISFALDHRLQAHGESITGIEARHYFAQGYAESGGPPELLETMFNTLVQR